MPFVNGRADDDLNCERMHLASHERFSGDLDGLKAPSGSLQAGLVARHDRRKCRDDGLKPLTYDFIVGGNHRIHVGPAGRQPEGNRKA